MSTITFAWIMTCFGIGQMLLGSMLLGRLPRHLPTR